MSSRVPPSAGPDWHLRAALGAVLAVLVVTALTVQGTRASAKAPSGGVRNPAAAQAPTTPPPRPAPGGGVTTTLPRMSAGGGCGFSMSRSAPRPDDVTKVATATTAPVGRCTIIEIGDSLGNDIGWGLARHLAPTSGLNLVQLDKSATGLANSSFFDWPAQLEGDLRQYHPQLVLVCLGGNDEQGMEIDGSAVHFPTPEWKSAYLGRVRQVISEAAASGAFVLWVGMPIMAQPSYSAGMQTLNALYAQGVASEPKATFLSTWELFSNAHGAYQSNAVVNGESTTLRQSDGIHYSEAGEDVLATYVVREMASIYHVGLTPTNPAVISGW